MGRFEFTVNCQVKSSVPTRVVKGDFSYPFNSIDLYAFVSKDKLCANETEDSAKAAKLDISYKSEAEYFVFTGVVSMLFVIVALVYYVLFEDRAKEATSTDVGLFSFPVVVSFLLLNKVEENKTNENPIISLSLGFILFSLLTIIFLHFLLEFPRERKLKEFSHNI